MTAMNRLPPSSALCTAAAVALAACGSGASAPPGSTPAAATASAPPGPLVDLPTPTVRIGPFVVTFATPLPADPAKAQVVEGFRQDEILWDQAAYSWHLGPALVDHVTGKARARLAAAASYAKK